MIKDSPAKTKSFLKAINKAAMQECDEIAKQIELTTAEAMQRAEDEASREGHQRLEAAKAKIEAKAKLNVANYEKEKKTEIYAKRSDYQQQVFEESAKKLRSFTQTDAFETYLNRCLANLSDIVGIDATFCVRPDDTKTKTILKERFPKASLQEDMTIQIGGFKAKDDTRSIVVDETLDAKLQAQTDWFLMHSGLKVDF